MDPAVQLELVLASVFQPCCHVYFSKLRSTRVVCSDASPHGHGLAYAQVPLDVGESWTRAACHQGDYTSLAEAGVCVMS